MKIVKNFILLAIVVSFFTIDASAIPAFARKYRLSCQTCHAPIPRLKPYGDDFAGNGFMLEDQEAPRYYVDTGDEDLSLIRDLPIAVRLDAYTTYNNSNSENTDFKTPYFLKLMSGGSLSDDVAYYFYFYLSERGEVAGIEDAYLMFNNLFGTEWDIYLGQFQVSDPLFKRELRLTLEDYEIYKTQVGSASSNLSYDRGVMLTYGFDTGTDLIFEIINGNGIGEGSDIGEYDNDSFKNFAARISQDIGENLRIGLFGYYGTNKYKDDFVEFDNEITYIGPDASISFDDKVEINLQYLYRQDSRPYEYVEDAGTQGGIAEVVITPGGDDSKYYFVGLANWVDSELSWIRYNSVSFHAGYLLRRNIRLVGELNYNFTNEDNEFLELSIGAVSAF